MIPGTRPNGQIIVAVESPRLPDLSAIVLRRTPMISILANTIRRFSDWNLRIRAGLEQGHKRFFNRNGS